MGIKDGEAKYLEKHKRRKGLQKTRFYCQICERQCLDENGFKLHIKSEVHMRNLNKQLKENSSKQIIDKFSEEFDKEFINKLRKNHGEKFVKLNKFYQELIKDRDHVHLNSTRWNNLTQYVRHLRNEKLCNIIEDDEGGNDGERYLIAYCKPVTTNLIEIGKTFEDVPLEFIGESESNTNNTTNNNNNVGIENKIAIQIEEGGKNVPVLENVEVKKNSLSSRKSKIGFSLGKKKAGHVTRT